MNMALTPSYSCTSHVDTRLGGCSSPQTLIHYASAWRSYWKADPSGPSSILPRYQMTRGGGTPDTSHRSTASCPTAASTTALTAEADGESAWRRTGDMGDQATCGPGRDGHVLRESLPPAPSLPLSGSPQSGPAHLYPKNRRTPGPPAQNVGGHQALHVAATLLWPSCLPRPPAFWLCVSCPQSAALGLHQPGHPGHTRGRRQEALLLQVHSAGYLCSTG